MPPSVRRSEQIKILREDFVSISIYRNVVDDKTYYDIVPARLIYVRQGDGSRKRVWKRGANFKPADIPLLLRLLLQAAELLSDLDVMDAISADTLDLMKLTG